MTDQQTAENFLTGTNATFVAELYARYVDRPDSVDVGWAEFFAGLGDSAKELLEDMRGASWAPRDTAVVGAASGEAARPTGQFESRSYGNINGGPTTTPSEIRRATLDSLQGLMMIRAYRVRGHLEADLDPLRLNAPEPHPELDYRSYGFSENDLDRPIFINYVLGLETATLRQILDVLHATYCGRIGVEFMHIQDPEQKAWIQERIEGVRNHTEFTKNGKRAIYGALVRSESFAGFLDKKYTGAKRFGLEGCESLIPALEQILKRGGQMGVREIVIGMAHRGRLNVLANVMEKPFRAIFSEFEGVSANPEDVQGSGDVKYHLGTSADRSFDGNNIHLSLTPNPSHLEAVSPVVLGKVRAKQTQRDDRQREVVMGLVLHGDAAFAGQGLVPETLDLSQLKGYRTGGTIHVIINNQIGFTTNPTHARSSPYSSDVAKMIQAPIFHVNGDDPEAVVHIARIAMEFRQKFKSDVVVDMFGYRRAGHNEGDEPAFTQPLMYEKIAARPTVVELYRAQLKSEGILSDEEAERITSDFRAVLDEEFEAGKSYKVNKADWLEGRWSDIGLAGASDRRGDTAVELELLREIGNSLTQTPRNFSAHRKIERQLKAKKAMFDTGQGIDWGTGEALAFGTLLCEATPVRLSGEDCGRGTFSHRHAVLTDQKNEDPYIPLNNIKYGQAPIEIVDSPLSEFGVLGFEYGYSQAEPHALVLWEAQFGDFANGAQIVIDQFITSGETKWLRMCGLVLLLPHGFEGQGPEHSSARPERFLQLCAEDNIQVVNCTTPASYFHVLRRQVRRKFRKPLVIMTPKSLLRHKLAVSSLDDFGPGSYFHRVLPDSDNRAADADIRRVVLCSGKVYYDLYEARAERSADDILLLRLEQLYPFPREELIDELSRFKNAEIVWAQEEPSNMGAWTFVNDRLEHVISDIGAKQTRPIYVGRPAAASPATGSNKRHRIEQATLVDEALTVGAKSILRHD